jgi:uncharacterized membrane protein YbhN (UPF0104 family)
VPSNRRTWKSWLVMVAKAALFAALCWFIYAALMRDNTKLRELEWHVDPGWLVVSGILYLLGILPAAVYWQRVLAHAGQRVGLAEALRAYYVSQLGKYVPGKWMVILIRRVLVSRASTETTVVAAAVFFETLSMLAVGSAVSAIVLLGWHRSQMLLIATAVGSFVLMGLPTVPSVFGWLIHALGVSKLNPTAGAKLSRIGPRAIAVGWLTMAAGWLLQGMSLWATLRALGVVTSGPLVDLPLHTTAVSLGVVAGFLSQIPGGLVVREWVSGELLRSHYGESVALVSAIILRLVWLVSELVISIILYVAGWRRGQAGVAAEHGYRGPSNHPREASAR